jgi:class 3 adenylate cyclase/tetratricopeptide (TPR) repeat protein
VNSSRETSSIVLNDDPRSYIAGDRRRALVAGSELPDKVHGAGLFADISGFTPLTEALAGELGPQRGAEELVANLNRILAAIIEDLHRFGGEVIYFSGDAITCWLDGDDGARATACALKMQQTMARVGVVTTPDGADVALSLKAAVAVGRARRFVVGDPSLQLIDVLAGSLIDDLAAAEQVAEKGEVVLTEPALASLAEQVTIQEIRADAESHIGVVTALNAEVAGDEPAVGLEEIPAEIARQWLLPTVYERLASGDGAFFAELRSVFPMFIRFGGIDFDADPAAAEKLDEFVRRAQHVLDDYGGNLLQLTLGDKGAYLYGVFGSPRVHEDEATRSVTAALDLQALADTTAANDIQIGISTGRVLSGTCGHPLRRTFACLGDPVNLAARLMGKAPARGVLVTSDVVEAADGKFLWKEQSPMALRGKADSVTAFLLAGVRTGKVRRHSRYPLPMVGREREVAFVENRMKSALSGLRRVVGIMADAGLGKSRLVAEIVRTLRGAGHRVVFGEAQAFGRNTSYLVWREPWHTLFGLDGEPADERIARVEQTLAGLGGGHADRTPLLNNLLELDIPDNTFTAAFDPKLRKTSLESLLGDVLQAELQQRPLVIVLEDCQWIDAASLDLLEVLVRESTGMPLLVVVAYRSEIESTARDRLMSLPTFEEIILEELTPADMQRVIAAKLEQQYGKDLAVAPEVVDFVAERGHGNPFYIEELINFLRRQDVDLSDRDALTGLDIPESLQALVLRRVDSLDAKPRQILKIASVIGREFDEPMLPGVYPDLGEGPAVAEHLELLGDVDLVVRSRQADDAWLFRHAITREVAYEGIPFQLRSQLHEAAGAYLERQPEEVEFNLDLLAHHYWHSDNLEKKVEYQRRAGQAAQAAYANRAAIEYYERLAEVVEEGERATTLLRLGEVLELVGEWERAEQVEREALALAMTAGETGTVGWCEAALAEVSRKQGRYDEAAGLLDSAATWFDEAGDLAGKGRVLHLAGTVAAQRGELDQARTRYGESLAIREALADRAGAASLLSNLGVVAEYSGDLDESRSFHERALAARTEIGDRWAIAVSNTNLGMIAVLKQQFDVARELFAEAMRLNEEVGDTWMVAVGHNNLGNAYRGLGDTEAARRHYVKSAEEYLAYRDRWAAAFLLEDVAILAAQNGRSLRAIELLGAADSMRHEIDTPRTDSLADELDARVLSVDPQLSEADRDAARRRGRSWGFDQALGVVIDHCCEPVNVAAS